MKEAVQMFSGFAAEKQANNDINISLYRHRYPFGRLSLVAAPRRRRVGDADAPTALRVAEWRRPQI
jgi:hypothetical protein